MSGSFLQKIVGQAGSAGISVYDDGDPFLELLRQTAAGKTVTVERALNVAAVWAAVRILSDTIGSLPLIVYRREGEGRGRADSSRSSRLLHDDPNPEMTAMTLWALVAVHLNTWGNSYLGKTFRGAQVTELWPIRPDRVRVGRERGVKVFRVKDENGRELKQVFTAREIIHLHGLTLDGVAGISPIAVARESIGAALAMDEYSNSFFREGALPRMVLKHKQKLSTLQAALADSSVKAIVLDIDSPGGSVFGVRELAQEIFDGRAQKPIVAVANYMAASAAYHLATQADELVVSPSAIVGSIGVFSAHQSSESSLRAPRPRLGRCACSTTRAIVSSSVPTRSAIPIATASSASTTRPSPKPPATALELTLRPRATSSTNQPYEPLSEEAEAAIQETIDEISAA